MADDPLFNEEFADAHNAEMSDEIAELNQRIIDLEEENVTIVRENKEHKQGIDELKASVEKLRSENEDLSNQLSNAQSENKAQGAKAAELQGEVSKLHHDLKESNADLSKLKGELEGVKGREKEKDVKLEAAEREKALLVVELDARDKQIQVFKKNVEEERVIRELEAEVKDSVCRGINGDAIFDGGKKGILGGLRQRELMVMGGTAIATAALVGCYMHASRKH